MQRKGADGRTALPPAPPTASASLLSFIVVDVVSFHLATESMVMALKPTTISAAAEGHADVSPPRHPRAVCYVASYHKAGGNEDLGFRVYILGFRVQGFGFGV